jgi:alpha-1,6-mannosyltransferase
MRIAQVANFVTPSSGGLRTTLRHLAEGYAAHGHETVQVLPGVDDRVVETPWGRQIYVRSPALPGTGYRVVLEPARVRRVLETIRPNVVEVHDRTTLRGVGPWARDRGVPSLVVSHERLDRWLQQWLPRWLPLTSLADRSNAALAKGFDSVVCTTRWAAQEFDRIGIATELIPLGVDHDNFVPRLEPLDRGPHGEVGLVLVSRLSREKRPELAIETVRELVRRGLRVRLVVAGDGPLRARLTQLSKELPVEFCGFVRDRGTLAALLVGADIVLAPGPVETFGLAALEALACATPVVVNRNSALPEVIGTAGRAAASTAFTFADAVQDLLTVDEPQRRRAAWAQALRYQWSDTVDGFLAAHLARRLPLAS